MSDLCPVAVSKDSSEDGFQPETAGESHLLLLKQKKYCDVTFTFPNLPDRIEAHQVFLKARSLEFAKIFRMRKSGNVLGNEIKINDSSPEVFQQFLEFIYADKLEVDIAGALGLLQLSHKYKVHPLTKKCEELLKNEIPALESIKIFEAARRYGRPELMDRAGQIMVKSFLELVTSGALANADEETLIYWLECDDLAVQEDGLFQFILDWGKKQVGSSGDTHLLRSKLKNLIRKIRYTNMAPDVFTKVVVPTGLLSAEETVSVYSYLCGDELTRRGLKDQLQFNTTLRKAENQKMVAKIVDVCSNANLKNQCDTTQRKVENHKMVTKFVDVYTNMYGIGPVSPTFSKHCISFQAVRTQVDGKVLPDGFPKTFIKAIDFQWPQVRKFYGGRVLTFSVTIKEHSGHVNQGNLTIRFQKRPFDCKQGQLDEVCVEPPVELVSGRTYSVIVENHSHVDLTDDFHLSQNALNMPKLVNMKREANINFEGVTLTLKDINSKTGSDVKKMPFRSAVFGMIRRIEIGLM